MNTEEPSSNPPAFDMAFVGNNGDEGVFTQEINSCADRLGASHKEKGAAQALSTKIKAKLDNLVANPHLLEQLKIEDVYEVGSVQTDTALAGHSVADIVLFTSSLPTQEVMAHLATNMFESFGSENYVTCYPKKYGCLVISRDASVRLLLTLSPEIASQLATHLHGILRFVRPLQPEAALSPAHLSPAPLSPVSSNIHLLPDASPSPVTHRRKPRTEKEGTFVLKKRSIILPSPSANLRRSTRYRVRPLRSWLGEQAVYRQWRAQFRLIGTTEVVVNDKDYIRARTACPVLAVTRNNRRAKRIINF